MRAKLAEKRAAQSKIDAKENKANEQIRRKAGQDLGQAREEMKKKGEFWEFEKRLGYEVWLNGKLV